MPSVLGFHLSLTLDKTFTEKITFSQIFKKTCRCGKCCGCNRPSKEVRDFVRKGRIGVRTSRFIDKIDNIPRIGKARERSKKQEKGLIMGIDPSLRAQRVDQSKG